MQWHLNDLSLDGQFATPQAFCAALAELLRLRAQQPLLRERLFCSRQLSSRPVVAGLSLQQAVLQNPNPLFKRQVLEWIGKFGPFWDDTRESNPNDYFEFQNVDVTEQGLGEAARRTLAGTHASVFSFSGSRFDFDGSPLQVQHGWREPELDFGQVALVNEWRVQSLAWAVLALKPEPRTWPEVLTEARQRFDGLLLAETIEAVLQAEPFSRCVSQRISELLTVLQRLVEETDAQGALSERGMELINIHFIGGKAWFSDSSDTEKQQFEQELTFPDPASPAQRLFCPWHGKIKTPQFRVHFEWPRPAGQRKIKVVYIGPKLTKR
jgi:hypothetical protein